MSSESENTDRGPAGRANRPRSPRWPRPGLVAVALAFSLTGLTGASAQPLAPDVEAAVGRGLGYLASQQRPDGSWETETAGSTRHLGVMALATLAFLANGHVGDGGRYAPVTHRAVGFLVRSAGPEGLLNLAGSHYDMYNHGLATLVLIEAYGMTGDPEIRPVLGRAVNLILRCQGPEGGWTYSAQKDTHDSSISVMQLLALRAARSVGIAVDPGAIARADDYVRRCYRPESKQFGYTPGGGPSYPLTASGTVSLLAARKTAAWDEAVEGGLAYLAQATPAFGPHDSYYYYGTYYAALAARMAGGRYGQEIYPVIVRTLLEAQNEDGSWQGGGTGKIMNTGIAVIVLSLPQDKLPLCHEETQ